MTACIGNVPRGKVADHRKCGMVPVAGWTICAVHLKAAREKALRLEQFMATGRENELMRHIQTLRAALQDAPHTSVLDDSTSRTVYESWYRQQRGPALDSTDPDRWKPIV